MDAVEGHPHVGDDGNDGVAAVAVLRLAELDVGKQSFNVGVQPSSQRGRRR